MEAHLDGARFLRTHRSAIVNVARIRELQAFTPGESILLLANGARVPLSRRRKAVLERLLGTGL